MAEITFGEWLRCERKRLRLTQTQLAEQVGCSTIALRKIEAEQRRPSPQIINRLAILFVIPAQDRADFLRFARGDWQAAPASILNGVIWRVERGASRPHLPAPLTSFIGREQDVAKVLDYLARSDIRLITLIGPPGVGKTRLSLQVAGEARADFADGVFFAPLASISDPALVAPVMVQALGLMQTDQRSAFESLKAGIHDRELLIVLDNFEQIVEAAPLVAELLAACPRSKILVTSRESLRVPGEWLYPVLPLVTPDGRQVRNLAAAAGDQFSALRLFTERAQAVRPDFALTPENAPTVAAICCRLDGLPLAIELIAARSRSMSPQALLSRLTSDFALHTDGMRSTPSRQKTLDNAIAWSYALLSRAEQTLLRRLAVFAGGWTLEAAEAVCAGGDVETREVEILLQRLMDKSLVITDPLADERRFGMLETIHEYARNRLNETGETQRLRQRHRDFFIALAELAEPKLKGAEQLDGLGQLAIERENLRAAWQCAIESEAEVAWRLASLRDFWLRCGNPNENRTWLAQLLERTDARGRTARRAAVLSTAGYLASNQLDFAAARQLLDEALTIARAAGDHEETAFALLSLGWTALEQRDDRVAQVFLEECLAIYQGLQDQSGIAAALSFLAVGAVAQGRYAEAEECFKKSLAQFQEIGDKWRAWTALNGLGELARLLGDYERADKYYEEAVTILHKLRSRVGLIAPFSNQGWVALWRGDLRKAQALFGESSKLSNEYGIKNIMPASLAGCAAVLGMTGQPEQAARLFGAVECLLEGMRVSLDLSDQNEFDHYVTVVHAQLDDAAFAQAWAEGHKTSLEQAIELALSFQTE